MIMMLRSRMWTSPSVNLALQAHSVHLFFSRIPELQQCAEMPESPVLLSLSSLVARGYEGRLDSKKRGNSHSYLEILLE